MRTDSDIEILLKDIGDKIVLTDYDLGVMQTLKWLKGASNPYCGRAKPKVPTHTRTVALLSHPYNLR